MRRACLTLFLSAIPLIASAEPTPTAAARPVSPHGSAMSRPHGSGMSSPHGGAMRNPHGAAASPHGAAPGAAGQAGGMPHHSAEIMLLSDYQMLVQRREAGDTSEETAKAFEGARQRAVAGLLQQLDQAKEPKAAAMPLYFLALMKTDARESLPKLLAIYTATPELQPVVLNSMVRVAPEDPEVRRILDTERAGGTQRLLAIELTAVADPPAKSIPYLQGLIASANIDDRAAALRGVAHVGPAAAALLDPVTKATRDESPEVRAAAARALASLAPDSDATVQRLMEMVDQKEPVGSAVVSALGNCGAKAEPALPKMRAYAELLPPVKALSVNMAIRKVEKAVAAQKSAAAAKPAAP